MTRATALLIAGVLGIAVNACANPSDGPVPEPSTATGSGSPTRPPVIDITSAGAKEVGVAGDWLTIGDEEVWLAGKDSKGLPTYYRLSPDGSVLAHVGRAEAACGGGDFWEHTFWTLTCTPRAIARIDPEHGRIERVQVPLSADELDGETTVGAGEGGIWAVVNTKNCIQCGVVRVDRKLRVVGTVPVTEGAAAVRAGLGSVWVSNADHGFVEQIDPATMKVISRVQTGPRPLFLTIGAGSVWALARGDGTITRYTPATKQTVTIDAGMQGAGGDLTFGEGSVWARGTAERLVIRIDPATNQVIGEWGPAAGPGAVAVGHGAIWISAYDKKKVWRVPLPS
jgi:virginiamycin B lyase